jgi:hypothetical protein
VLPKAEAEQQQGAERGHQHTDLLREPAAVDGAAHQEDDAEEGCEAADPGEHAAAEDALELDPRDRVRERRRPRAWRRTSFPLLPPQLLFVPSHLLAHDCLLSLIDQRSTKRSRLIDRWSTKPVEFET